MDFLHGLAKAGQIDFYKIGNGRPDTDYRGKGEMVLKCLVDGYDFVACHVNGPDEASHMYDVPLKITSIERTDEEIVLPVIEYFMEHRSRLGGIMVLPDHYTNTVPDASGRRIESHSLHPVPFTVWNGRNVDDCRYFSEDEAAFGIYGAMPVSHLQALEILDVFGNGRKNIKEMTGVQSIYDRAA
jgi:2,3-bisphosphoglycerate-independent phosphoglycerate mutase